MAQRCLDLPVQARSAFLGKIGIVFLSLFCAGHFVDAAPAAAPQARSPVIESIEWAPTNSILRRAKGSDRFPMTRADDDAQYTAWGDGVGFRRLKQKLSLG